MKSPGLYTAPKAYSPEYPFRLSISSNAFSDVAFCPTVTPTSETTTGAPRNCGTRPVGLFEKGDLSCGNAIDFTYRLSNGTTRISMAGVENGSKDSKVVNRLPKA